MRDETRTFWWFVRWVHFWSLVGLIFGFSLCCKSPQAPDIDTAVPTIEYFTSTDEFIYSGIVDSTALQWKTQNADTCNISPGIGEVETSSPAPLRVSPEYTTTYVLTAKNDAGSAKAEVRVEVRPWLPAKLSIRFDPEIPIVDWHEISGRALSYFTTIITDENEVGGQISKFLLSSEGMWAEHTTPGHFEASEDKLVPCTLLTYTKPTYMNIYIEGIDYHYFWINVQFHFNIIWDGNEGSIVPVDW